MLRRGLSYRQISAAGARPLGQRGGAIARVGLTKFAGLEWGPSNTQPVSVISLHLSGRSQRPATVFWCPLVDRAGEGRWVTGTKYQIDPSA